MSAAQPHYTNRHGTHDDVPGAVPGAAQDAAAVDAAWAATVPPARTSSYWDTPPGFIPAPAPRRRLDGLSIALAVLVIVAVLGAAGIVAYQVLSPAPRSTAGHARTAVQSTVGHFVVELSGSAERQPYSYSRDGLTLTGEIVGTDADGGVLGVELNRSLGTDQMMVAVRGGVLGLVGAGRVSDEHDTTFRGHRAVYASAVSRQGEHARVVAVAWTGRRFYMFLADTDADLKVLESTFVALP